MNLHSFILCCILQSIYGSRYRLNPSSLVSPSAQPSGRILGGEDASETERKYQCKVELNEEYRCGCALIKDEWALTSSNCVTGEEPEDLKVMLGEMWESHDVEQFIPHKEHHLHKFANDIALIKLEGKGAKNIAQMQIPMDGDRVQEGAEYEFIGLGRLNASQIKPTRLQKIKVKAITKKKCRKAYGDKFVEDTHFCTLPRHGEGACFGDSGSPLFKLKVSSNPAPDVIVLGVASFAIPCGIGYPDAFTDVYSFREWIDKNAV